ncbi:MAG TPA: hypothetical protein VFT22_07430 [Kofleriaceae bacterium]|nr:hypothetical protein [Kofleriaceae bacterium]
MSAPDAAGRCPDSTLADPLADPLADNSPAIPPPNPAQISRGRELGERLHAIAADVSAWMDEAGPSGNDDRRNRAQIYGHRVLASLREARTDLGTLALVMAEPEDA